MKKKRNHNGFTLGELLIVVGIIAVLVAISIPIFNRQLEKSRDAASVANIRSAYAGIQAVYMDVALSDQMKPEASISDGKGGYKWETNDIKYKHDGIFYTVDLSEDGSYIKKIFTRKNAVNIESHKNNHFSGLGKNLPFKWKDPEIADKDKPGGYDLEINYDRDGNVTNAELYQ